MKVNVAATLVFTIVCFSLFGLVCLMFAIAASPPQLGQPNYCSDTPEGQAVVGRMVEHFDRFERLKVWDNEAAVLDNIWKLDKVQSWALANTTGNEQKAWLCWADYYIKKYYDQLTLLHAKNTIKNPF